MGWHLALWIISILVAFVIALAILPIGIFVRYHEQELKIWCCIGPIHILLDLNKPNKPRKKKMSNISIRKVFEAPIKANREYDNLLGDFIAEIRTVLGIFGHLQPKLRVNRLMLHLHLAGSDPAMVALQYGGAWSVIGAVLPFLEEAFTIKMRDLDVDCNFNGEATSLDAEFKISIGLGRLLYCLLRYSLTTLKNAEPTHIERR